MSGGEATPARSRFFRRRVACGSPRGKARCEGCRAALRYDVGSVAWGCVDRDLCPACAGAEAAGRVIAAVDAAPAVVAPLLAVPPGGRRGQGQPQGAARGRGDGA